MALTDIQICNLALSRIGARASIASLSEATNEARACNMAYTVALEATLVRFDWSFCAATAKLVESGTAHTAWVKLTAYTLGAFRRPSTTNGYAYECTTAGTSGSTEPTWPTTAGATVADGSVVWTCREPMTEWEYSYTLPSDCLKVRRIISGTGSGQEWEGIAYEIQGAKLMCNEADIKIRYTARPADTSLFPASFIEAFAAKLATRLALALGTDSRTVATVMQEWAMTQPGAEAVDANQSRRNPKPDAPWITARN